MTSTRMLRSARIGALSATLLATALSSKAADLASTYAYEAFPQVSVPEPARKTPCRHARLRTKTRSGRKPGAVRRETGAAPEIGGTERAERGGVVAADEEIKHR